MVASRYAGAKAVARRPTFVPSPGGVTARGSRFMLHRRTVTGANVRLAGSSWLALVPSSVLRRTRPRSNRIKRAVLWARTEIVLVRPHASCPYIASDPTKLWLDPEAHLNAGRRSDLHGLAVRPSNSARHVAHVQLLDHRERLIERELPQRVPTRRRSSTASRGRQHARRRALRPTRGSERRP